MPVFIILTIFGIAAFWFLASFLYRPIGRLFSRIFNDAKEEINKEDDKRKDLK